ncbi:MAG: lipopolysaccharide heptosyltransferase family protein [Cytophagales bacterium]|nr:MAG: lipopolysaccharide heptosyltransferase family protein [Cytophagales bacterium]
MKIAIIKQGALGDLIALSTFLIPIKKKYPQAEITILASNYFLKVYPEKLLYTHFHYFDKHTFKWYDYLKSILFLRTQKYDYIFQLRYGSEIDDFIAACSGAKNTIGFRKSFFSFFLSKKIKMGTTIKHEYLRMLDALKIINIDIEKPKTDIYSSESDKIYIQNFLEKNNLKNKQFILIAPKASAESKEWLPEQFVELGKLISQNLNIKIVIDNGLGKDDFGKNMALAIGENAILSPPTTIHQFGELIRQSGICVCNNSAAMNMAYATNTIAIVISSLPPSYWGALGENDTTLYPFESNKINDLYAISANDIQRREILNKIKPTDVFEEIKLKSYHIIN